MDERFKKRKSDLPDNLRPSKKRKTDEDTSDTEELDSPPTEIEMKDHHFASGSTPHTIDTEKSKPTKPPLFHSSTQHTVRDNSYEMTDSLYFRRSEGDSGEEKGSAEEYDSGEEDDASEEKKPTFTPNKMKPRDRNLVGNKKFDHDQAKDMLKIAVISQEASRNFSKRFHEKGEVLQNGSGIGQPQVDALRKNVNRTKASQHEEFSKQVTENKRSNHVIIIVEGEKNILAENLSIPDIDGQTHQYTLQDLYIEGKNSKGARDAKQNMFFYVRNDMEAAIEIEKIDLPINSESFPVGKINFSTENDGEVKKYSLLAVHIPNKFATTPTKDSATHKAFKDYANKRLEGEEKEIVIGYVGDTNYSNPMAEYTTPPYGGLVHGKYLPHTSSGARKHTDFMQAVHLNEEDKSFGIQQPNTLNICDVKIEGSKVATDHPSIQTGILLTGEIAKRKSIPKQCPPEVISELQKMGQTEKKHEDNEAKHSPKLNQEGHTGKSQSGKENADVNDASADKNTTHSFRLGFR